MSVQFGRWNTNGKPVDVDYLEKVKPVIAPYGPDDGGSYTKTGISILYRAFHTTEESRRELQPHITESGAIITWDGRLDNRADLICQLRDHLTVSSTDVSIVVAAYQEWGTDCFAKLIGDWALSIWNAKSRSLILAKDPIGARHLYYSIETDHVTWCTILDPLVLFATHSFALNKEYIAGWLSFFPATHLTPYIGIHSVPPSSSVVIRNGKQTVTKYWDFDPGKRICYRADAEYEEHFRIVFAQSVRRRLRSDTPVLAELSGGVDSSSIICMADTILARREVEMPTLDTVSYYDDTEPHWNESPYFFRVEKHRHRSGCHVAVGWQNFDLETRFRGFRATPNSPGEPNQAIMNLAALMTAQGNRVLLSGIGGDEVSGGVPTFLPELADLLARGRFRSFADQINAWALARRKPLLHLAFETVRAFFPHETAFHGNRRAPALWVRPDFVRRNLSSMRGNESRLTFFGPPPSYQESLKVFESLQRQLGCTALPNRPIHENRYPYLDRDLLEFLFGISPEQLVRPMQRRSLMRRALAGIVPDEVLNRKRKAFVTRGPRLSLSSALASVESSAASMISARLGYVSAELFTHVLRHVRYDGGTPILPALRTLKLELWLRDLAPWNVFSNTHEEPTPPHSMGQRNTALSVVMGILS